MAIYSFSRNNVAMNTAQDLITLVTNSTRRLRLLEVKVIGMGTTSAAGAIGVYRSTGGTTPGGALTPPKFISEAPTANVAGYTTWAAQPSLSGDPLVIMGPNQNGTVDRWLARPGEEIEARNAEQLSIRPLVGSHNISITIVVEEL